MHGWTLFDWLMRGGEEGAAKHMQHMWELFLDGTIQPLTGTEPLCIHAGLSWNLTLVLHAGLKICVKVTCWLIAEQVSCPILVLSR